MWKLLMGTQMSVSRVRKKEEKDEAVSGGGGKKRNWDMMFP